MVERLRAAGYTYSARALNDGPWEAVFMAHDATGRGSGPTLHIAIRAAALDAERDHRG